MVLGIEHVVFIASNDHDAVVLVLREANVHLVVVHDATDVLPALTDQPSVHARVYVYFLAVLAVLYHQYKLEMLANSYIKKYGYCTQIDYKSKIFGLFVSLVRDHISW